MMTLPNLTLARQKPAESIIREALRLLLADKARKSLRANRKAKEWTDRGITAKYEAERIGMMLKESLERQAF